MHTYAESKAPASLLPIWARPQSAATRRTTHPIKLLHQPSRATALRQPLPALQDRKSSGVRSRNHQHSLSYPQMIGVPVGQKPSEACSSVRLVVFGRRLRGRRRGEARPSKRSRSFQNLAEPCKSLRGLAKRVRDDRIDDDDEDEGEDNQRRGGWVDASPLFSRNNVTTRINIGCR